MRDKAKIVHALRNLGVEASEEDTITKLSQKVRQAMGWHDPDKSLETTLERFLLCGAGQPVPPQQERRWKPYSVPKAMLDHYDRCTTPKQITMPGVGNGGNSGYGRGA